MGGKPRSPLTVKHPDELRAAYLTPGGHLYILVNVGGRKVRLAFGPSQGQSLDISTVSQTIQVEANHEIVEVLHGNYARLFDLALVTRDGEVLLAKDGVVSTEHVREWEAQRKRGLWRGRLKQLRQVEDQLFALGERGQIYCRPIAGGWKQIASPESPSTWHCFLDVTTFDGELFFGGFESLSDEGWRKLKATTPMSGALLRKWKEKRATLWHLGGNWEEVSMQSDANACLAMQTSRTGPTVWLSSGEQFLLHQGELKGVVSESPCKVIALGSEAILASEHGLQRVRANGAVETLPIAGEQQRLLGATREGLVASFGSEVAILKTGKEEWRLLALHERAPQSFKPPHHDSYQAFLQVYPQLYGAKPKVAPNELVVWNGVSQKAKESPNEGSDAYWFHDLASLYGPLAANEAAVDPHIWGEDLMAIGYPIGIGYDGSHFIQSVEGEIFHVFGDEWIEDEAREDLIRLSPSEFFAEWGHHCLSDNFRDFYQTLCEQRGTA